MPRTIVKNNSANPPKKKFQQIKMCLRNTFSTNLDEFDWKSFCSAAKNNLFILQKDAFFFKNQQQNQFNGNRFERYFARSIGL